jgi:hypothetical protein
MASIEDIKSLRTSPLRHLAIANAPPTNSDPLARYFISAMGEAYPGYRGKKHPMGRTGPFVNFLEAAWYE